VFVSVFAGVTFSAAVGAAEGWSVIDGDTIRTPSGLTVRVANIDAPEAPGKCKCEAECCRQAEAATAYVRASLRLAGVVELRPYVRPVDRYGRTLAYVLVDGKDLGDEMVNRGLARPWDKKRKSWCDG
jgi:micrococcal nuclease